MGLNRLDTSLCKEEDAFDRTDVTVEVHQQPETHAVVIEKLKRWVQSHGRHADEEATPQTPQRCSRTIGVPMNTEAST